MRKFVLFLSLGFLFLSCTEDVVMQEEQNCAQSVDGLTSVRSVTEAEEIALSTAKRLLDGDFESRSSSRIVDPKQTRTIYSSHVKSRNTATPLMYVVNFSDDEGFAIVPANVDAPHAIVVAEVGNFDPSSTEINPGFDAYMSSAERYLEQLSTGGTIRPPYQPGGEKTVIDTLITDSVDPQICVKWWQRGVFGDECSNGVAGCTNVAIAMMLTAFHQPSSIELTYKPGSPVISLNWSEIERHNMQFLTKKFACKCHNPDENHQVIAQLIRQIGELAGSIYYPGSESNNPTTPTPVDGGIKAIRALGLKSDMFQVCYENIISQCIERNTILFMYGEDNGRGVSHNWICDGMKELSIRAYRYITKDNGLTWVPDGGGATWSKIETYNHFCWGYENGEKDGYFLDMSFAPGGNVDYGYWTDFYRIIVP